MHFYSIGNDDERWPLRSVLALSTINDESMEDIAPMLGRILSSVDSHNQAVNCAHHERPRPATVFRENQLHSMSDRSTTGGFPPVGCFASLHFVSLCMNWTQL